MRKAPRSMKPLIPALIAVGGALTVTIAATWILSQDAGRAVSYLVTGPVRNSLALGNTLALASRLTLSGIAASLAFRSGIFNLGGEGQALAGGLAGAAWAMSMPALPALLAPLSVVLAGMAAGGALGAVSGILRSRWDVDELISTFLIAAAVGPAGHALLSGPMQDAGSYLIAAPPLADHFRPASWLPPSRLGPAALWAAAATLGAWLFLTYMRRGYEWKLRGANEAFARYGGFRTGRIAVSSLIVSGALFGLSGSVALLDGGQAIQGFTGGLGWDGLAVALIAGSRPGWVPVAALAYAWLSQGTQSALMHTGFPFALSGLVQAVVFLLVTMRRIPIKRLRKSTGGTRD